MKTFFLFVAILLFGQQALYAAQDTTSDSPAVDSVKSEQDVQALAKSDKDINARIDDIVKKLNTNITCVARDDKYHLSCGEWALVWLPVAIFMVVVLVLLLTGLAKFDLNEALKENELTKITVLNPHYRGLPVNAGQTDIPTTIEVTANVTFAHSALASPPVPEGNARYEINDEAKRYRPSISRFIAFISSFLIIITAVCMGSFFIYHYIKTGCPPSLGSFTTVLIALGIGIVPYAANRVSAAVSSNKSEG